MGGESRNPIQDRKDGEVFLGAGFHLGAVQDRLAILSVGHLFLREGGAKDVLG